MALKRYSPLLPAVCGKEQVDSAVVQLGPLGKVRVDHAADCCLAVCAAQAEEQWHSVKDRTDEALPFESNEQKARLLKG